jgi:hypothetical protein
VRRRRGDVDLDLTDGDGFLYVLSDSSGAITGFSMNAGSGALTGSATSPVLRPDSQA